jgi:hypothetical protein
MARYTKNNFSSQDVLEWQALKIVVEIIKRYLPAGQLSFIVQERLTILAWVALWRPGELLLYEWYPFKRNAKLFGKLERAEMQVIAKAAETNR